MDKNKAFNEVQELLTKNGIEYTVGKHADTITAKVGRIIQWFMFTDRTLAIASAITIGKKRIETSRSNKWYEDITGFSFIKGDLWIREKSFGYTIITLNPNN